MQDDYQQLQVDYTKLQKEIEELRNREEVQKNTILQDLLTHAENPKLPYSSELISLATEVQSISHKAYTLLVDKLNFPKESVINQILNDVIKDIPDNLTNIEKGGEIIDLFREKII